MPSPFDPLWERLLRGGVGRRHARRYLTELRDHLDDLIAEERLAAAGSPNPEARALARLGGTEVLARAMIARREFQDWSAKAPVATYLIAPPLVLAICTALAMVVVVSFCTLLKGLAGFPSDLPPWMKPVTTCVVFFSNGLLSVLLGWAVGAMALRQRSAALWPFVGILVLAAVSAALQVGVTLPSAARLGEINLMIGPGSSVSQWTGYAGRLGLNLALTLTPYAGLSLWRSAQADGEGARG